MELLGDRVGELAGVRAWQEQEEEDYYTGSDHTEQNLEMVELRRQLGDLLAVIHRDGGHYQAEHGTEKAVADAHERIVELRTLLQNERYWMQAAKERIGELEQQLADAAINRRRETIAREEGR